MLFLEHFPQHRQCFGQYVGFDLAQPFYQTGTIHSSQLFREKKSILCLEPRLDAKRGGTTSAGERNHSEIREVPIHGIGRYDQARAGFLNFAADRGIKFNKPDFEM